MYKKLKDPSTYKRHDALEHPTINICPSVHELLKKIADEKFIPVSKLIAIAIDNELDSAHPFAYDCNYPDGPFIENANTKFAQKINDWMMKNFIGGLGIDQLILCRRAIGVENKNDLLLGLRELLEAGLVIETRAMGPSARYYPRDYKVLKIDPESRKYAKLNAMRMKDYKINPPKGPLTNG